MAMAMAMDMTIGIAGLLAVAGCSSQHDPKATPTPRRSTSAAPTPPLSPSSAPSASPRTTAAGSARGCSARGSGVPKGATVSKPLDVDGDGCLDTVWAVGDGARLLAGITTASGDTSRISMGFAGAVDPFIFAADADGRGTVVVLVGNNRGQSLYRWFGCRIQPGRDAQGQQYAFDAFDAGFAGQGRGIGCSQVKGAEHRDLVGLLIEGDDSAPKRTVKQTQIVIEGLRAHNGLVDRVIVAHDNQAAKSAPSVSCGDRTPQHGGAVLLNS